MKKEELTLILQQTFIDFFDSLLTAYDSFHSFDYPFIKKSLKTCKFGNFNLYDVIGTQQGFEYILDNFGLIYRNSAYRRNILRSIFVLQSIRSIINKPIYINSFFRSYELNALLNGVKNSYHTKGLAFDIKKTDFINSNSIKKALKQFLNLFESYPDITNLIDTIQIIEYDTFIHIELDIQS